MNMKYSLFQESVKDMLKVALKAKPVNIHVDGQIHEGYEIKGEIYTFESAIEDIISQYTFMHLEEKKK